MIVDKFNFKDFQQRIYQRAILKVRKLRQSKVKTLGYYLWKDIDPEIALKQVIDDPKSVKSEEELLEYVNQLLSIPFNKEVPLWEIRIIDITDENAS